MVISHEFDESMAQYRKRKEENAFRTAAKLNDRIKHFIANIHNDKSIRNKKLITDRVLKDVHQWDTK